MRADVDSIKNDWLTDNVRTPLQLFQSTARLTTFITGHSILARVRLPVPRIHTHTIHLV